MMTLRIWFGVVSVLALTSDARAQVIDFSVPYAAADGYRMDGVEFDFKIDGIDATDAYVGSYGPGQLETISDPSLTGAATGELTMQFDLPTSQLEFAVALATGEMLSPGFTVNLYNAESQTLGEYPVTTTRRIDGVSFSEGVFRYEGAPISRAVVQFAEGQRDFALDNIAYVVPEPTSLAVFLLPAFAILARARRSKLSRPEFG